MPSRANLIVLILIGFIHVMVGGGKVIEPATETGLSMQEYVHSLSDHLIYLNSEIQSMYESKTRVRRSDAIVEQKSSYLVEYVSIDCNLTCWIQTSRNSHHVLMCKPKPASPPVSMEVVPVRVECTEHRSGRLLHILLSSSVEGTQADFLSDGFSTSLRNTLLSLSPSPEVLYLTIELSIMQIRHDDFKHISTWLRRLSLFLANTTTVDRGVLKTLALDSFKADGCDLMDTTVSRLGSVCSVEFLLSCPEREFLPIIADLSTHKTHCNTSEGVITSMTEQLVPNSQISTPSYQELEAIVSSLTSLKAETDDYQYMLLISIWTNAILASLLIIFLFLHFIFLCQRSHTNLPHYKR